MMRPILSEYYGDSTRWFIATVVNSVPEAGYEGRVKIRIHGLHSENTQDIPEDHLPWAQCVLPTTEGGVSGIGKIPRILPSALVFGMFMDGKNSQTPIVLGSLPKMERPSQIQLDTKQIIVDDNSLIVTSANVDDGNQKTLVSGEVKTFRLQYTLQFFLNIGYSYNQAIGITENLSQTGMLSGGDLESGPYGIAGWRGTRLRQLKEFTNNPKSFTRQVEFIAHELNTTQRSANIRLLRSEKFGGKNGSFKIFAKYYLKMTLKQLRDLESIGSYSDIQ